MVSYGSTGDEDTVICSSKETVSMDNNGLASAFSKSQYNYYKVRKRQQHYFAL